MPKRGQRGAESRCLCFEVSERGEDACTSVRPGGASAGDTQGQGQVNVSMRMSRTGQFTDQPPPPPLSLMGSEAASGCPWPVGSTKGSSFRRCCASCSRSPRLILCRRSLCSCFSSCSTALVSWGPKGLARTWPRWCYRGWH